jgi:hypothetical protein
MMEQTQKMKIDPTKPWPFPVVLGVSKCRDNRELSDFVYSNALKCREVLAPSARVKYTKQRKCPSYDTFEDCEEALF